MFEELNKLEKEIAELNAAVQEAAAKGETDKIPALLAKMEEKRNRVIEIKVALAKLQTRGGNKRATSYTVALVTFGPDGAKVVGPRTWSYSVYPKNISDKSERELVEKELKSFCEYFGIDEKSNFRDVVLNLAKRGLTIIATEPELVEDALNKVVKGKK